MLTHAAADLPLPDDVGMAPAHYGVHVEARRSDNTGYTLLRRGPYFQTWLASRDADRLNTLKGRSANVIPGFTVTAKAAPFHVSDHESYADPHGADIAALLADALAEVSATGLPNPGRRLAPAAGRNRTGHPVPQPPLPPPDDPAGHPRPDHRRRCPDPEPGHQPHHVRLSSPPELPGTGGRVPPTAQVHRH